MSASTSLVGRLPLAIRDTALTVTGLHAKDALDEEPADFREKCVRQVDSLKQELTEAGYPTNVIDDALYAQCALLDEAVLRCLKTTQRDAWERQPLQVSRFNSHDAGEELIRRMNLLVHAPQPEPLLLRIFHIVLLLGFHGKYAAPDGAAERQLLIRRLADRLEPDSAGAKDDSAQVVINATAPGRWHFALSPVGAIVLAAITAALVYGGLQYWLSLSISALTTQ